MRETHRERDRDRDTEKERDTERDTERERDREREQNIDFCLNCNCKRPEYEHGCQEIGKTFEALSISGICTG